jgi:hypothetical protein
VVDLAHPVRLGGWRTEARIIAVLARGVFALDGFVVPRNVEVGESFLFLKIVDRHGASLLSDTGGWLIWDGGGRYVGAGSSSSDRS